MKVILLLLVISSIAFAQPPSADYVYDSSSSSTFTLSTGNTITRWDDPIGFSHFLGCTSTATYLSSGGIKGASSVQCSSTCLKTNQFILEPPYYTAAVVQASGAGNIISQTAGTMSHRMFDIVIDSSYNVDVWVGDTKITSSPVSVGVYGFLVSVDVDDSNNSATARINGTSVGKKKNLLPQKKSVKNVRNCYRKYLCRGIFSLDYWRSKWISKLVR